MLKKYMLIFALLNCFNCLNLNAVDCKETYEKYFKDIQKYDFGMRAIFFNKTIWGLARLFLDPSFTSEDWSIEWAKNFANAVESYIKEFHPSDASKLVKSAIQYLADKGLTMKFGFWVDNKLENISAIEYLEKIKL